MPNESQPRPLESQEKQPQGDARDTMLQEGEAPKETMADPAQIGEIAPPDVRLEQHKTPEQRRKEYLKNLLTETFVSSQIFREYLGSSGSVEANSKHEWVKGLYDFMAGRVQSIADDLPTSTELEERTHKGSLKGSLEHTRISRSLTTIVNMSQALEQIGLIIPSGGIGTSSGIRMYYDAIIEALEDAMDNPNAYYAYYEHPTYSEEIDEEYTEQKTELEKVKGLPYHNPRSQLEQVS